MNKSVLAVVLVAAMVSGTCMTAWADEHGGDHGTQKSAAVGTQEDFTEEDGTYQGSTQFYIKVDKDSTGKEITIPAPEDITGDGKIICHYDVDWKVTRSTNVRVTVPLYVCMYGYGGDGTVVAPDGQSYYMENNSTYTDQKKPDHVYACYAVTKILSLEDYRNAYYSTLENTATDEWKTENNDGDVNSPEAVEAIKAIAEAALNKGYTEYKTNLKLFDNEDKTIEITDTELSGQYGYYKKTDEGNNYLVRLTECDNHSENTDCDNKTNNEYFYKDTSADVTTTGGISTSTVYYANGGTANNASIAINVPTIKTEVNTWDICPADELDQLGAGQIVMNIKGLDLSDVDKADDSTLNIRNLNWFIEAAEGSKLPLPVSAAIAGGSVNEEGCVPVVRVIYTVAPAINKIESTNYAPSAN